MKTLSIEIHNILNEDSTIGALKSNTKTLVLDKRAENANKVQLNHIQYIPAVADSILIVKADTRSSNKSYDTSVQCNGVEYVTADIQGSVPVESNGQTFYIMPIHSNQNTVAVSCTCMDFYWRFAMYNKKDNSLIGEPPAPYVKKTDRAPQNPEQVSGACKHIHKLINQLQSNKIFI